MDPSFLLDPECRMPMSKAERNSPLIKNVKLLKKYEKVETYVREKLKQMIGRIETILEYGSKVSLQRYRF